MYVKSQILKSSKPKNIRSQLSSLSSSPNNSKPRQIEYQILWTYFTELKQIIQKKNKKRHHGLINNWFGWIFQAADLYSKWSTNIIKDKPNPHWLDEAMKEYDFNINTILAYFYRLEYNTCQDERINVSRAKNTFNVTQETSFTWSCDSFHHTNHTPSPEDTKEFEYKELSNEDIIEKIKHKLALKNKKDHVNCKSSNRFYNKKSGLKPLNMLDENHKISLNKTKETYRSGIDLTSENRGYASTQTKIYEQDNKKQSIRFISLPRNPTIRKAMIDYSSSESDGEEAQYMYIKKKKKKKKDIKVSHYTNYLMHKSIAVIDAYTNQVVNKTKANYHSNCNFTADKNKSRLNYKSHSVSWGNIINTNY